MKPIFVVLIAVGTAIVGSGIGFLGGLTIGGFGGLVGGGVGGAAIGACYTIETAKQEGLINEEQGNELFQKIEEKIEKKLQETTSDPNVNLDNLSCEDVLEGSNI